MVYISAYCPLVYSPSCQLFDLRKASYVFFVCDDRDLD